MKPAYNSNILKKMRKNIHIMDKMRSEMPFMDEFGMVEAFATFPHGWTLSLRLLGTHPNQTIPYVF